MTRSDANVLSLTLESGGESIPLDFPVRRLVNAGFVGRDREAVRAHIDELRHEGIPAPPTVPILFPLTADNLSTAAEIEVISPGTSGEVEYVLFLDSDEVYVGVGSDHTDRSLERASLNKSKQICKNVVSRRVWRHADVESHWDDLLLRGWVRSPETGEEILYQEGSLRTILAAVELIELVRSRIRDRRCDGLVIFSGTLPILGGKIISGDGFRGELLDSRTGRSLSCSYRTTRLDYLAGAGE
jgi:hypothetical protein